MPDRDGLVVVDKPAGMTSHDVVGRLRRIAGTRRVGHAGTLDPMATGVLVVGVGQATKLLGHLSLADKTYEATIRLGVATLTDDAEGEVVARTDARDVEDAAIRSGVAALTGELAQVPSAVSAIKVGGVRAYRRVRQGETVQLAPRRVTVRRFAVLAIRRADAVVDVDVRVECSSGTYVRALARDLGAQLRVGGHLTALRRTRVGPYGLDQARRLDELEQRFETIGLTDAATAAFPQVRVDAGTAAKVAHGVPMAATGAGSGPVAVLGPDGGLVALVEDRGSVARYLAVFAQ